MSRCANLWAVGFDDTGRAAEVRDELTGLAWEKHHFNLLDVALAVRHADGSFTLNGDPFPVATHMLGHTATSFLAGLALGAPPMSGAAVSNLLGEFGACAVAAGISDDVVREVEGLVKPGTSVLFVLDDGGRVRPMASCCRSRMIAFRKSHPSLGRPRFWRDDVRWFGVGPSVDLSYESHSLAYCLHGASRGDCDLYVMINAYHELLDFEVREGPPGGWRRAIDTGLDSPLDIAEPGQEPAVASLRYRAAPRSVIVLLGRNGCAS